jgi:hypothetical protein
MKNGDAGALRNRSLVPKATKVILTNFASAEYENLCVQLGADGFFDKSQTTV